MVADRDISEKEKFLLALKGFQWKGVIDNWSRTRGGKGYYGCLTTTITVTLPESAITSVLKINEKTAVCVMDQTYYILGTPRQQINNLHNDDDKRLRTLEIPE